MVFCGFGDVSELERKCDAASFWAVFVFFMEYAFGRAGNSQKRRREKTGTSFSSIFNTGGNLADSNIGYGKKYRASFTVEATVVLGIVFFCIASLIGQAYRVHDTVTGSMILEEALLRARGKDIEEIVVGEFEAYGETLGNPRLWLGEYEIELEISENRVSGTATAGDWSQMIEIEQFQPWQFLRRFDAIKEMSEELTDDGSGIQAGDEPELHGDPAGTGVE